MRVKLRIFQSGVGLLGKKSRAIFELKMRVAKKSAKILKFCEIFFVISLAYAIHPHFFGVCRSNVHRHGPGLCLSRPIHGLFVVFPLPLTI
jgi:hypothetical protein